MVKTENLELCCNHVRKERLRTCQTSEAGSRQRKHCGFLSARDSPLGLSKRSGKIKALSQCQQSPRMMEIPGGMGILKCHVGGGGGVKTAVWEDVESASPQN